MFKYPTPVLCLKSNTKGSLRRNWCVQNTKRIEIIVFLITSLKKYWIELVQCSAFHQYCIHPIASWSWMISKAIQISKVKLIYNELFMKIRFLTFQESFQLLLNQKCKSKCWNINRLIHAILLKFYLAITLISIRAFSLSRGLHWSLTLTLISSITFLCKQIDWSSETVL